VGRAGRRAPRGAPCPLRLQTFVSDSRTARSSAATASAPRATARPRARRGGSSGGAASARAGDAAAAATGGRLSTSSLPLLLPPSSPDVLMPDGACMENECLPLPAGATERRARRGAPGRLGRRASDKPPHDAVAIDTEGGSERAWAGAPIARGAGGSSRATMAAASMPEWRRRRAGAAAAPGVCEDACVRARRATRAH